MRAILTAVGYSDLLAVSLPWNRCHFDEVYVVTDTASSVAVRQIAARNDARVLVTDLFYFGRASFAKWLALEWGLDQMGREGWLCIMDADVLIPKAVEFLEVTGGLAITTPQGDGRGGIIVDVGKLCTPLRHMWTSWPHNPLPIRSTDVLLGGHRYPGEEHWGTFAVHRNVGEWAGYSQIFHASDPHLGPPPWHQTDWTHAGGADSVFQAKWPPACKVRPPFKVLHLGPAGANWCGRASPLADGTTPPDAAAKSARVAAIWEGRRGKTGDERFRGERLT